MSLNNAFQGLPISEVVPEAVPAMNDGMTKSSLLVSRRKIRFQPQTGTSATPGSIAQFVLADSSSLLDVNSATISFNVNTTGTGIETLDDGPSVIRRVQVSLNGNLVEDVDHAHRLCNMEVYGGADQAWYKTAGSYAGFWKFNPDLSVGTGLPAGVANAGQIAAATYAYNPRYGDIGAADPTNPVGLWSAANARTTAAAAAGVTFAGESRIVPLSLLSGFFRCKQYIPLALLGELVISFTLASGAEACLQQSGGGGGTDASYSISDLYMEVDVVQPHYALMELMTKSATSDGESGIVIPYESAVVSQGQAIASGPASVIISRATNNLRRLLYAHQLTAGISAAQFPSVSCFGNNATTSWQVRCGSLYFPSQPASSDARMFGLLQSVYGEAVNDKPGIINRNLYTITSAANGAVTALGNMPANPQAAFADAFIVGYNFDSYKNTSGTNVLDADGVSILGMAGSQIVVQVTQTGSVTPVVALMATRYLSLQNGTLKIVGV